MEKMSLWSMLFLSALSQEKFARDQAKVPSDAPAAAFHITPCFGARLPS
jgi:hypothetical protein